MNITLAMYFEFVKDFELIYPNFQDYILKFKIKYLNQHLKFLLAKIGEKTKRVYFPHHYSSFWPKIFSKYQIIIRPSKLMESANILFFLIGIVIFLNLSLQRLNENKGRVLSISQKIYTHQI